MSEAARTRPSRPATRLIVLLVLLAGALIAAPAAGGVSQRQSRLQQAGEAPQDPDQRAAGGERVADDEARRDDVATLMLAPSRLQLVPGQRARLSLSLLGAEDVRRLPATLRYDATVVRVASVRLGSAWQEGAAPVLLHDMSRPGELVIGLGLLDREQPGVSGTAELLEIEVVALARGTVLLRLESFAALSAGARPQEVTARGAEIIVR